MRLALLVPVLICVAAPAHAEGARESRYGPTSPRQATAAAAAARYDGPMLGWSNKRQAATALASLPSPATLAAPLYNAPAYATTPARAPYAPPSLPTTPALPTSLYAPPPPSRAATATAPAPQAQAQAKAPTQAPTQAKDWSTYRSARVSGLAPVAVATSPPVPEPTPAPQHQVAVANTGETGARYYSVGRDYGLTPDAAPRPSPDNRVLITTSEPPPEPKDATPIHGSADWLAAGVAGDEDQNDDSASRRAKTRNEAL